MAGLDRPSRLGGPEPFTIETAGSSPAMTVQASSRAAQEGGPDRVLVEVAADEDDARDARLTFLPRALQVAVEDHVHALEDEAFRLVRERDDALAAQDVRSF